MAKKSQVDDPAASFNFDFNGTIRILILEHDSNDLDLIQYELTKSGIPYAAKVVSAEKAFEKALTEFSPDIILSDFSMPTFNGLKAFELRQDIAPEIPFIFVSGYIGEEKSIELIKSGLTDYVMKDKLFTLTFKLTRALKESKEKKAKIQTEKNLVKNEYRLNEAQKIAHLGSWEKDCITGKYIWSEQLHKILGMAEDQQLSQEMYLDTVHPEDREPVKLTLSNSELFLRDIAYEHRLLLADGSIKYVYCETRNEVNPEGLPARRYGIVHDITERKLAEQQKEFDANNLKALINNTKDMMWSVDLEFRLITSNDAFETYVKTITGKTSQKGISLLQLGFYEEQNKRYKEFYERAFSGESFTIIEYTDSPVELWSEISFYPILGENTVIGTACYSRDITERKLFEKELERSTAEILGIKDRLEISEKSLKEAQKLARLGNWESHLATKETVWSEEAFEIMGVKKGEIKPSLEAFLSFVHPEDLVYVKDIIDKGTKDFKGFSFNSRIIQPGGALKYLYVKCRFAFNPDGKPLVSGIIHDVTESQLAKDKLSHSEARLKQAQAITHVGNWEIDFSSNISLWSDEAFRIYGLEPSEHHVSAMEWLKFIHPEDRREVVGKMRQSFNTFTDFSCFHRVVRRDGTIRHVCSECKYEFNAKGQPVGLYGIVYDMTEQKKTEMQLQGLLDTTKAQNKRLQNFAYIVSHNIRSHSSNIIGLMEVFKEAENDAEREGFFKMLETSTGKLEETIENLNEIITIQSDTREKKQVNLRQEIEKACQSMSLLILQTNTIIVNDIAEDTAVEVVPAYLESILQNLVSNGIKYRSALRPVVIKISAAKSGNYTVLSIEDNGMGIDLDKNGEKIFGMYKTFHYNDDARGLGLFIAKNQVEAMNGKIEVESTVGTGSVFRVYLA